MKENQLNNYVVDLLKSIEQNLSDYPKHKKLKYLHRLRVDIKKIKAVFSFTEKVYKEKYNLTNLKLLFHKAGNIREIQINIHLLCEFPHPPERLINELKRKENSLTEQFINNVSRYIRLIKNFSEKVCLPETIPGKKRIKKYFEKEKHRADSELQNKDREGMHRYRMKIKKIMYVYNILPKKLQKEIELNEAEINSQQRKLGSWHDIYSAIHFLSHKHFPEKTVEYILKMKEKERRQFNSLLKKTVPLMS